ncbi:MAG: DUF6106 family protein [Firmicutes bacterium]|nr:DUF6106 family protein [Bacillota bacterium]
MRDVFNEQLVKKKPTAKDTAKKAGIIAAVAVLFFIAVNFIPGFAVYVLVGAGVGAYFLLRRFNIEYEYIFTNGELDIDAIYGKSTRKRLFSGDVSGFEIMAHVSDRARERELSGAAETRKYFSGAVGDSTYAFIASYKGKRVKVIIEPDDRMLEAISSAMPKRKFFRKGY